MRVRVAKVVKFLDNLHSVLFTQVRAETNATLFDHFCQEIFFLQKCMILYCMYASINCCLYILITPFQKTISLFSRSFCQKILSLHIQEGFVIKTRCYDGAYHISEPTVVREGFSNPGIQGFRKEKQTVYYYPPLRFENLTSAERLP